jgi:hypothetical protein
MHKSLWKRIQIDYDSHCIHLVTIVLRYVVITVVCHLVYILVESIPITSSVILPHLTSEYEHTRGPARKRRIQIKIMNKAQPIRT